MCIAKAPSVPAPPPPPPTPVSPEVISSRQNNRKRAVLAGGLNSTIVTSAQGLASTPSTGIKKSLLGV